MSGEQPEWIIPASIPFEDLKDRDLEECLYWLLDAMGAKDIEWRVGSSGRGAADGGRDLEAQWFIAGASDEPSQQTWWFECKGRKKTVESEAVRNAATNALAYKNVDAIVVVTNTRFSNPATEWAKEWNEKHDKPQLHLWDCVKLERLISRQPTVALRLFTETLSVHGKMEALRSRFWNRIEFTPDKVLEELWQKRQELSVDGLALFALIANEIANKSIGRRPWGTTASRDDIVETLGTVLANFFYLYMRVGRAGVNQEPIFAALNHLILFALRHIKIDEVITLIEAFLVRPEGKLIPDDLLEILLDPVLNNLKDELTSVCVPGCDRVHEIRGSDLNDDIASNQNYFRRFVQTEQHPTDNRILWLERLDGPCKVGFKVDKDHRCPVTQMETKWSNIREILGIAKHVVSARISIAKDEWHKDAKEKKRVTEQ